MPWVAHLPRFCADHVQILRTTLPNTSISIFRPRTHPGAHSIQCGSIDGLWWHIVPTPMLMRMNGKGEYAAHCPTKMCKICAKGSVLSHFSLLCPKTPGNTYYAEVNIVGMVTHVDGAFGWRCCTLGHNPLWGELRGFTWKYQNGQNGPDPNFFKSGPRSLFRTMRLRKSMSIHMWESGDSCVDEVRWGDRPIGIGRQSSPLYYPPITTSRF